MRIRLSFCYTVIAVSVFCLAGNVSAQTSDEMQIFQLVNRERARLRKPQLTWNSTVANVARDHSRKMASEGFFGHRDRRGKNVQDRAGNISWRMIGENLFMAAGMNDFAGTSVKSWLRSSSHRKNMLNGGWTDTGIGVYRTRDRRVFVTQVFIRR